MEVEIEVCSKEKHGVDSYLFVGSGEEEINYQREAIEKLSQERYWNDTVLKKYSDQIKIDKKAFQTSYDPYSKQKVNVIFGSSVKGNVKSRLQLTLQPYKGTAIACIYPSRILKSHPPIGTSGWRHFKIWEDSLQYVRENVCNATARPVVCLLCDLFGAPGLSSLIEFGTFYMTEGSTVDLGHEVERVAAAKPGSRFRGSVSFKAVKLEELGLLLIGMGYSIVDGRHKSMPVLLGSHKYRGLNRNLMGRVTYNVLNLKTSSRCKGDGIVTCGTVYEKGELENVLINALKAAFDKFGPYIKQIDECRKV
ncbi:MAG: hypothetical protein QXH17_09845 [Candidatus Bathyarchaeia archaeon]